MKVQTKCHYNRSIQDPDQESRSGNGITNFNKKNNNILK